MNYLPVLFLLLAGIESWAQTSYVPATQTLGEKGYQLGLYGDYFNTTKTIDPEGNSTTLTDDQSFKRTQLEVLGLYGLTPQLQVGAGARFRQNTSSYTDGSGEKIDASSSGFESTVFHLMYAFDPVGRLQYTLEGLYRFTPYTNDEYDGVTGKEDLVLGDHGNEMSGGLGVTYAAPTNSYFLTARAGLRNPGKELSNEIYWQAEGALRFRYLALVAGVDGVSSLKSDPHEGDLTQKPVFNTGVSRLYNSTDREWVTPYAGLNVALGPHWRVELRGSQVVSGNSTDLGTAFGVNLVRRVDTPKRRVDEEFKEYDIEASVSKVSPKKEFVVIDKGLSHDVEKGMRFDIFEFNYVGGNVLLARGVVVQAKSETAIVKITERFNPAKELKEGQVARASIR